MVELIAYAAIALIVILVLYYAYQQIALALGESAASVYGPKTGFGGIVDSISFIANPEEVPARIMALLPQLDKPKRTEAIAGSLCKWACYKGTYSDKLAMKAWSTRRPSHVVYISGNGALIVIDGHQLMTPVNMELDLLNTLRDFQLWQWDDTGYSSIANAGRDPYPAGTRLGIVLAGLAKKNNISMPECFFHSQIVKWQATRLNTPIVPREYDPTTHRYLTPPASSKRWTDDYLVFGYESGDLDTWAGWAALWLAGRVTDAARLRLVMLANVGGRSVNDPPPILTNGVISYDPAFPGDVDYGVVIDTTDPNSPHFGALILVGAELYEGVDYTVGDFRAMLDEGKQLDGGDPRSFIDPEKYSASAVLRALPGGERWYRSTNAKLRDAAGL